MGTIKYNYLYLTPPLRHSLTPITLFYTAENFLDDHSVFIDFGANENFIDCNLTNLNSPCTLCLTCVKPVPWMGIY